MLPQGLILNEKDLQEATDYFLTQDHFFYDVETTGNFRLQPQIAPVSWISLATTGCCIVIPLSHERGEFLREEQVPAIYGGTGPRAGKTYNKTVKVYGKAPEQLDTALVFDILRPLFFNPDIRAGAHDKLFDVVAVSKYFGAVPTNKHDDSKIGYWLLDENNRQASYLKNMIKNKYDFIYDTENIGACVESHPFSVVAFYSYCDAKFGHLCMEQIRSSLQAEKLMPIYNLEMSVLNVMIGMRLEGALVDVPALEKLRTELSVQLIEAEGDIYKAAGHKFNIRSNPHKREVLFNEQKLKPWKLTDAGKKAKKAGHRNTIDHYSVDADVLAGYPDNPVCSALRAHGGIDKILNTYVNSWLGTDEDLPLIIDSRIHAGFQQYGTVTGRFSCRAPNLQNPPRPSSDLGKRIRDVFIAGPDNKLVIADYAQIELVILAHYIGRGALYEGFLEGIDPHTLTAAMVLNKTPEQVSKIERQDLGKTLGFAVVYGAGIGKVSSMAHLDWDGAKRILKTHEKMFPEIHQFKKNVIDYARSRKPVPHINTLLGRCRRIPALNSRIDEVRMGAERQIFNSLIQGGAGDILKLAMVRLDAMLPPEAKMILTVHDELVVSCPESISAEVANLMREAMTGEGIQRLIRVPLKVDIHVCDKWSEAK